jgi:hypothetical protein
MQTKKKQWVGSTPLQPHSTTWERKGTTRDWIFKSPYPRGAYSLPRQITKILSANCKGFCNKDKDEALKNLIKLEKPNVIMLLETNMEKS